MLRPRIVIVFLLLALASAAPSAYSADAPAALPEPPPVQPYRLQGGDALQFRFPFNAELDFASPIRPDGSVSFPYLGDVELAGRTLGEARELLLERFRAVLKEPEVFIFLSDYRRPKVYVAGEVPIPGRIDFYQGMSIHNAIFTAGGYTESANRRSAVLIRRVSPGQVRLIGVSLKPDRKMVDDVLLAPDDVVLVPKSAIANLNQIVRQYSRELLPVSSVGIIFRAFDTGQGSINFSAP